MRLLIYWSVLDICRIMRTLTMVKVSARPNPGKIDVTLRHFLIVISAHMSFFIGPNDAYKPRMKHSTYNASMSNQMHK